MRWAWVRSRIGGEPAKESGMDHAAIVAAAKGYEGEMVRFLRDLIAIEGYSGGERKVIERIKKEVKKLGAADKVWVDGMGNLLVRVGKGPRVIGMDAHIDTVGVGNP